MNDTLKSGLILATLLLVGAGCSAVPSVKQAVSPSQPSQPQAVQPEKRPESFVAAGLRFELPNADWRVVESSATSVKILTEDSPYHVYLTLDVRKEKRVKDEDVLADAADFAAVDLHFETNGWKVWQTAIGGAQFGAYVGRQGDKEPYLFIWDVKSDESAPANLDGIWRPAHKFQQADIWNIMKTLQPAK